jgi:prepilin-type N-terminal cleavage/methylation domain-containing protein
MRQITQWRARGFTLVEMLIVAAVIIALFGIGYPILTMARANAEISGTTSLVEGVAAAISTYGTRSWSYQDGTIRRTVLLWDLNDDGQIDGNPAADETLPQAVVDSGYVGLLDMAQPPVRPESVNAKRQIIDAWGNPLRIRFPDQAGLTGAAKQAERLRFGTDGFQVYSAGPDGGSGTDDDTRHGVQNDD